MITDPQVVKFANETVRPLADRIAGLAMDLQAFLAVFDAKGFVKLIPDDESGIDDGSKSDGRTPITGHDVHEIIMLANDLVAMATGANSKIASVLKISVNSR